MGNHANYMFIDSWFPIFNLWYDDTHIWELHYKIRGGNMQFDNIIQLIEKPTLTNVSTHSKQKWDNEKIKQLADSIKTFMTKNKYYTIGYTFAEINRMLEQMDMKTNVSDHSTYSAKNSFKYTLNKHIRKYKLETHIHTHNKTHYLVFAPIR